LAVLKAKDTPSGRRFETEPILVEDFLTWMERRHGFVIAPGVTVAGRKPVSLDEHRAFRENVRAFKDRLREIGFYDDRRLARRLRSALRATSPKASPAQSTAATSPHQRRAGAGVGDLDDGDTDRARRARPAPVELLAWQIPWRVSRPKLNPIGEAPSSRRRRRVSAPAC
jgi:hypothetical protein